MAVQSITSKRVVYRRITRVNKLELRTCSVSKKAYIAGLLIVNRPENVERLTARTLPKLELLLASFLGAFTKLRKATISFIVSVKSVRLLGSH